MRTEIDLDEDDIKEAITYFLQAKLGIRHSLEVTVYVTANYQRLDPDGITIKAEARSTDHE